MRKRLVAAVGGCALCVGAAWGFARPIPAGESTTTIGYTTTTGPVAFSGDRNYFGAVAADAVPLVGAPNIRTFNSNHSFGRRTFLANSNPMFSDVLGADETLIAHAFFKIDLANDYFPSLVEGSDITLTVENIQFDQPVTVVDSTFMMHVLWNTAQADALDNPYIQLHDHHTATSPFRDFDSFVNGGVFSAVPVPNYALGVINPTFTGEGTDTLNLSVSFPYEILRNLEELGQAIPSGLPAPRGFLEPFHFHFEYVVVPEPATLWLAAVAVLTLLLRRGRSSSAPIERTRGESSRGYERL